MDKYSKKRLKILLVYFVLFAIIVGGIYLLISKNRPTCYDGIQNQGEAGVDCGDPCAPCEWQKQEDLEVLWTKAIKTRDSFVDLAAKIRNPNKEFGAKEINYEFVLYNNQDQIITSLSGSSYISPQKSKYIIKQKIKIEEEITRTEFKINSIEWQELVNYQEPDLLIQNTEFNQNANKTIARGVVENRSNFDFDTIDIFVILFNGNDNVIGAGKMQIKTVLSNEKRDFEMMWPFELKEKLKRIDVTADTNIFLEENFMKRHGGERERFQEY